MNKKILVLIVVLLFLVALTLVGIFAFKINKVEVTTVQTVNSVQVKEIQEFVDESVGKNILFFNETVFKKDIEKKFKNIKVVDTKRHFPNLVQVYIEERQEVFAIKKGSDYFVLDKYLNVLEKQSDYRNSNDIDEPTSAKNLVLIENIESEIEILEIGEKLKLNNLAKQKALEEITNSFFGDERLADFDDTQRVMSMFHSIDLEKMTAISMYTKNADEEKAVEIEFTSDAKNLLKQLQAGIGAYYTIPEENKTSNSKIFIKYDRETKGYYCEVTTEGV